MAQVDVVKESIAYEKLIKEVSTNNVLKSEHLIKDSHPDVFEILGVDAKTTINSKEVLNDKIMIEGQIKYSVLYVSEDESRVKRVNTVVLIEKFSEYLDVDIDEHKMICDVESIVEHIEVDIMNERKISIDGIRATKWCVFKVSEFEFVKDIEDTNNVQIKKSNEEVNKIKGRKQIDLIGKSIIKVSMDKPEVEEILKCSINIHKKEMKIGDEKVYFGCYCKVEILYKGRELDDLVSLYDDVYLSKEEELIGVNSDMISMHEVEVLNYDYTVLPDDLGENRNINVEFLANGELKVLSKEFVDVIKDAYSPNYDMQLVKESYDIGLIHGYVNNELMLKDNLYFDDDKEKANFVLSTYGQPIITDKKIEDEKIKIEGVVKTSVLYKSDDENTKFSMCNGEIPFTFALDVKGSKETMDSIVKVNLESLDAIVEANTIGVRATVSVNCKVMYNINKEWIVDIIQTEAEKKEKKSSISIYVVNKEDTLWDLAKKFNTTINELSKINDLDESNSLSIGEKIIIPGRALF